MTTDVDPYLIAEINQIETPCQIRERPRQHCSDPAAWLLTFTHTSGYATKPVPACLAHKAAFDHRDACQRCGIDGWTVTAEEL